MNEKWATRGLGRVRAALRDRTYWLAVAVGLLGWLVWEPVGWGWLAPVVPAGCFWVVRVARSAGGAMRRALALGAMFYFAALHWLCTVHVFGFAPAPAVFAGICFLAVYTAFYPALGVYVLRRWAWGGSLAAQYAGFCGVWLIAEWLRTLGRLAMPLGQLGHAWAPYPRMIQVASELGELGVTLEVLWAGGILVFVIGFIARRRSGGAQGETDGHGRWELGRMAAAGAYLILPGVLFFGVHWGDFSAGEAEGARALRVGLVQPNVEQMVKLASYIHPDRSVQQALQEQIMAKQERLAVGFGGDRLDLLVLPETSFTQNDFMAREDARERAWGMAARAGADMLFSADRIIDTPMEYTVFNTAYMVTAGGEFTDFYDKMRLVPFGESMPYFDKIPGIKALVDIGTFGEGTRATQFATHGLKFGTMICFESTFSQMGRRFAREGADFLTVVTNDAWYGMSAGPAMHYRVSLLRAVETRRWVVRCANTGISAFIDPQGREQQRLELGQEGTLAQTIVIPREAPVTLFMRMGNMWLWGVAVGLGALGVKARKRAKV